MKDNIDNVIRKKYEEVETPQIDLNKIQFKKNSNIYKIAIVILLLIITIVDVNIMDVFNNENTNQDNVLPQNIIAENDTKLPIATETIRVGLDMTSIAFLNVDYVAIVKVNKILGYTNYSSIQNKYLWPITKFQVTIERVLKGNIKGTIQIYKSGGIISIANWEKTLSQERIERYGYNKLSKQEKENTYINVIMGMNYNKIELDKKYLVFLKEDKEIYGGLTVSAGYMEEFDEKTNSTRYGNDWLPIEDNELVKRALEKN